MTTFRQLQLSNWCHLVQPITDLLNKVWISFYSHGGVKSLRTLVVPGGMEFSRVACEQSMGNDAKG